MLILFSYCRSYFKFGGKDTDGDGIYDKDDACPDVAGLKEFNGCPDTDGDGIQDSADVLSRRIWFEAALNGCPDTDGDYAADKDDACPDVFGLAALKRASIQIKLIATTMSYCCRTKRKCRLSWPDTDGDGVLDKDKMSRSKRYCCVK
jgi:hypothetical protein